MENSSGAEFDPSDYDLDNLPEDDKHGILISFGDVMKTPSMESENSVTSSLVVVVTVFQ